MECTQKRCRRPRYALTPYINQFILGRGWVEGWEDYDDARRFYIKYPTIKKADKNLTFDKQKVISKEHHINLFLPFNQMNEKELELVKGVKMYDCITFSGRIQKYWRKDGTYDFSVKSIPQSYMEDMIAMIHKEIKSTIKKAGAITPDTLMVMEYYTKPKLNAIDKKIDDAGDLLPTFNGDYQYYKNEVKEWKNAIDICINHIRSVSSNRKFRRRYGIKENFAQYYPPYEKL